MKILCWSMLCSKMFKNIFLFWKRMDFFSFFFLNFKNWTEGLKQRVLSVFYGEVERSCKKNKNIKKFWYAKKKSLLLNKGNRKKAKKRRIELSPFLKGPIRVLKKWKPKGFELCLNLFFYFFCFLYFIGSVKKQLF